MCLPLALLRTKNLNNTFMKTALTVSFLFVVATAMAQTTTEVPRSEFVIALSATSLSIRPGETKQVKVSIIRSRAFAKGKVTLGLSSAVPKNFTIAFEPTEGNIEMSIATITAGPDATEGIYQLIFNGTIHHKTKGTVLKLSLGSENVAAQ